MEIHTKTKKRQGVVSNKQKHAAITHFVTKKGSPEKDEIAAPGLNSVYHGVKHGHPPNIWSSLPFLHKPKVATLALSDADSA